VAVGGDGPAGGDGADQVPVPGALEEALLGARTELDREEVSGAAGVPELEARAIWNALGFPVVAEGEKAFTRRDVEALRTATELRDGGLVDADTLLVLARSMGQGLARMAEAQVDVFRELAAGMTLDEATQTALHSAQEVLPRLEQLVVHVWRRQFAAATARAFATGSSEGRPPVAVGFVDIVDFTASTRVWDSATLEALLERFERETSLRVTAFGGRVVKTLGDEVMYATDDPLAAVEVALDTVAAHAADDELPDVRAGVAFGPVLERLGDVFGEPVNLASRLVGEARPRSVLVDPVLLEALAERDLVDGSYDVQRLRKRSVRGYRSLTPHLLRRTEVD
jgi:adenylate cyclase